MNVGQLDQRVTLERFTTTVDEIGQPIEEWAPLAEVWAAVEPINGREFFAATAAASEVTTKIRIRYRPGITAADRVNHGGMLHAITTTINPRSGNRELILMCKAVAA